MQTSFRTAAIAAQAGLEQEALGLARPDLHPKEYVALLLERKLHPDAVRFMAHSLPKREAVWWAWMCARRAAGDKAAPAIRASLEATEKWIAHPTDENRRAAMAAAEKADFGTAAGCAGLAAFFSGGSMAPPEAHPVPPGERLTGRMVAVAIMCSAVSQPEIAPEKYEQFVAQALDVANRIKLWEITTEPRP